MDPGQARRLHHLVGLHLAEAGDVFRHRAGEQFDVLRQVADARAEGLALVLADLGAVQAHAAVQGRPDAQHYPRQARLAGAGRTDHADHRAGRDRQGQATQGARLAAGRRRVQRFQQQVATRLGQFHAPLAGGEFVEQAAQPAIGIARRAPLLPHADQLVDRPQRTSHQDRAGDHHPRGDASLHRQPGAEAEHQGLQGDAQVFTQRVDPRRALAGQALLVEERLVQPFPAPAHAAEHAHRLDHLGVAQVVAGQLAGLDRQLAGLGQRRTGGAFVEPGEGHQGQRADQREQAEPGVEEEDHQQVDREPGCVEEGEQRLAGDELAQGGQVVQRLAGLLAAGAQVAFEGGGVDPPVQLAVEAFADPHQDEAAQRLQRAHEDEHAKRHQGQHQQGDFVGRGQHAVVHLQHVQRGHQHQQVDHPGERRHAAQCAAAGRQGLFDFVGNAGTEPCHRARSLLPRLPLESRMSPDGTSLCRAFPRRQAARA